MSKSVFSVSDLANTGRVEFIRAARAGKARLRDKDGTSLVMIPEEDLDLLEGFAMWSKAHLRLEGFLRRDEEPSINDLGDLAWLRYFDREDLHAFSDELHEALIAGLADRDIRAIDECVEAWRLTSRQLEDPLRRSILTNSYDSENFVDAERPSQ